MQPSSVESKKIFTRPYCFLFIINLILSLTLYMTNPTLAQHLGGIGIGFATAGTLIGVMSISSMIFRPFSGWISDHFQRKKLLALSLALMGISFVGYAVTNAAALFFIFRVLHGIAFGMTTTVTMAYVSEHIPPSRVGEGMGYFALGQSVATAIGPFVGLSLLERFHSSLVFLMAGLLVGLCLVLVLCLPYSAAKNTEQGLPLRDSLNVKNFIAKEAALYAILTIAISATNGIETSFLSGYAETISLKNIGWYFTVSACTLFLTRLFLGKLSDRIGFAKVFYPSMLCIAVSFFLLSQLKKENAMMLLTAASILKAVGIGTIQPGIQAACIKSVPDYRRGSASSTYYIGADLGQGGATAAAGGIIAVQGYSGMFLWFIIPLGIATITYFVTRFYQKKKGKTI